MDYCKKVIIFILILLALATPDSTAQRQVHNPNQLYSYRVATLPANTATGMLAYVTDCESTSACTVGLGTNKLVEVYSGTAWALIGGSAGSCAGDLSGTYPNCTVAAINGAAVPVSGTVLGSNASRQLVAATTSGSGTTVPLLTSPVFVTPTLGAATATTINKITLTAPASGATLTLTDGKTLSVSNTMTLTATDGSTIAGGAGGTVTYKIGSGTLTLATTGIASGACATAVTGSATGLLTTDDIMADFNSDPTGTTGYQASTNGMLTIIKYPTADTVNVKVCNNTGSTITPGARTLNFRVTR